jgi:hypothetical protein
MQQPLVSSIVVCMESAFFETLDNLVVTFHLSKTSNQSKDCWERCVMCLFPKRKITFDKIFLSLIIINLKYVVASISEHPLITYHRICRAKLQVAGVKTMLL